MSVLPHPLDVARWQGPNAQPTIDAFAQRRRALAAMPQLSSPPNMAPDPLQGGAMQPKPSPNIQPPQMGSPAQMAPEPMPGAYMPQGGSPVMPYADPSQLPSQPLPPDTAPQPPTLPQPVAQPSQVMPAPAGRAPVAPPSIAPAAPAPDFVGRPPVTSPAQPYKPTGDPPTNPVEPQPSTPAKPAASAQPAVDQTVSRPGRIISGTTGQGIDPARRQAAVQANWQRSGGAQQAAFQRPQPSPQPVSHYQRPPQHMAMPQPFTMPQPTAMPQPFGGAFGGLQQGLQQLFGGGGFPGESAFNPSAQPIAQPQPMQIPHMGWQPQRPAPAATAPARPLRGPGSGNRGALNPRNQRGEGARVIPGNSARRGVRSDGAPNTIEDRQAPLEDRVRDRARARARGRRGSPGPINEPPQRRRRRRRRGGASTS